MSKDSPEARARYEQETELVEIIARQVLRTLDESHELADLMTYGKLGLLDAARRYDPGRGVSFRTFANYRVRGAIIDGVRAESQLPRRLYEKLRGLEAATSYAENLSEDFAAGVAAREDVASAEAALADHLGAMATAVAMGMLGDTAMDSGEPILIDDAHDPESLLGRRRFLEAARGAILELPEQERILIERHYFEGLRFDQVASELGLSKSWASRLHRRAVQRLARRLKE